MEVIDLLAALSKLYKEKCGLAPAKTKLLKLAYLAEVYYKRISKERLTKQIWLFWKYGPYFGEFEKIIRNESYFDRPEQADDFYPVEVKEELNLVKLNIEEKIAILRALDHADDELNQILDFVYFDTEPMIKAKTRGEILDFNSIMPEEYYRVKDYKINKKESLKITEMIKEWEKKIKSGH